MCLAVCLVVEVFEFEDVGRGEGHRRADDGTLRGCNLVENSREDAGGFGDGRRLTVRFVND